MYRVRCWSTGMELNTMPAAAVVSFRPMEIHIHLLTLLRVSVSSSLFMSRWSKTAKRKERKENLGHRLNRYNILSRPVERSNTASSRCFLCDMSHINMSNDLGMGKREAHKNWSMVMQRQHTRYRNYLEDCWELALRERTLGNERQRDAITCPEKLGTGPKRQLVDGINGRRREKREEPRE